MFLTSFYMTRLYMCDGTRSQTSPDFCSSVCADYINSQNKKWRRPGKEKANGNKYFSSIYYYCFLLSHCSFLKSIDHNVLNAVTWHQSG